LEDDFNVLLECPLYYELRKTIYIKPYYWKILNMPRIIELMTTENVSMYITCKAFEIRKKKLYFD